MKGAPERCLIRRREARPSVSATCASRRVRTACIGLHHAPIYAGIAEGCIWDALDAPHCPLQISSSRS